MDSTKQPRLNLSKSLFIRGRQCPKSLYLHRYHPELRDDISDAQQWLFQSGTDVGIRAQGLYPGGTEIAFEGSSIEEQIEKTKAEIEKGTATIYEAAFNYDEVFCKVDILRKTKDWELSEVKGTTEVKDVHIDDTALQYYVLRGAGIDVKRAHLVHLNNGYVRNGALEIDKLFTSEDITDAVMERQATIKEDIERFREVLKGDMPATDIGEYCNDPYPCDFQGHCWQHIPEESVLDLKQRGARPFDFYRRGIIYLRDIPLHEVTGSQLMQLEAFLYKKEFIDPEQLRDFLATLWYPLYFLDFETYMFPIPPYDGMRPYQQMPFQYSLHSLEREGAELHHSEYLAEPNMDPRADLAEKLLDDIPQGACVVAYNASFEAGRLRELGDFLPQHKKRIDMILDNVRDLIIPFRKRFVYHREMKGSYSQKAVLPALVPELSYDGLEVAEGGAAMDAYLAMCNASDQTEVLRIRKALLAYCKTDTLGMVRILERLRQLV